MKRRDFVLLGTRTAFGTLVGSVLAPVHSFATVFNTGAFWKRRLSSGSGQLWGSGGNTYGELGDGTHAAKSSPVQVGALTGWAQVACGYQHTLALKTDGTLWSWGLGTSGQLGDGTATSKSSPVQVGALTTWAQIAAGHNGHSLAIKTDGTLWSWGSNNNYGLGTSGVASRSSPVQVGALTDWQQVAAGNAFGAAVKTDGTLWTWGTNNYGQNGLGTSTATMASSPTQVGALTTWAKVATGYEHVLALKSDGTLWSWGNNGNGQLGDGTAVAKSSPIQIGALTTWKDISAGVYHSLAIQNDGSLWGWGENYSGQAAGVSMTSPSSPVQIGSLTTWSKVAASYSHTFALKVDGTLWSWGDNSIGPGNLGSGSTSSRTSPVQVGTVNTWSTLSTGSHVMYIRSS